MFLQINIYLLLDGSLDRYHINRGSPTDSCGPLGARWTFTPSATTPTQAAAAIAVELEIVLAEGSFLIIAG